MLEGLTYSLSKDRLIVYTDYLDRLKYLILNFKEENYDSLNIYCNFPVDITKKYYLLITRKTFNVTLFKKIGLEYISIYERFSIINGVFHDRTVEIFKIEDEEITFTNGKNERNESLEDVLTRLS